MAIEGSARASYTSPRPDVSALVPPAALRILDVGSSNGALGASLRAAVPGRYVCGIEGSEPFCREAATRLDRAIHADLNAFDWDAHLRGERFDCIVLADVLEHLVDPWTLLREATAYLADGGLVIVSAPNIRHVSALNSIFLRGTFPRISRGIFDRTHLRWFTLADLRALLEQAGLRVERVSQHLRLRDAPGGSLNRWTARLLRPVQGLGPVREFLTYQFVVTGRKPSAQGPGPAGQ